LESFKNYPERLRVSECFGMFHQKTFKTAWHATLRRPKVE
jgi:hypothetical protein